MTQNEQSSQAVMHNLVMGAIHVSAAMTGIAALIHYIGVREVFPESAPALIAEIVAGFTVMFLLVLSLSAVFQYLSYHTPIPPVVRQP